MADPENTKPFYNSTIPSDWGVKTFDNVTKAITCGLASTPTYVEQDCGMPFFSAQNVQHGKVIFENFRYIPRELFSQITKTNKPLKGDLLYTRVGAGIGEAAIIERDFEFAIYVSLTLIKPDDRYLNNRFLLHLLNSPTYRFLAKRDQFAGGGVQNLNVQVVKKFLIPLPPLPEQKAIAHVLGLMDSAINRNNQLIAQKELRKKWLMQNLLTGKKRIKGFANEWKEESIRKITKVVAGGTPFTKTAEYWNGNIPWMNSGELNLKRVHNVVGRITELGLKNSNTRKIPKHCVLIGLAGQGKTRGTVAMNMIELCTNQSIAAIYPSTGLDNEYLYYCLDYRYDELRRLSTGDGGRGGLNLNIINSIHILLPPIAEQTAIAQVLQAADKEIQLLKTKTEKLREQKKGMMQQLLTGQKRLRVED